jgi:hypothetical protein
MIEMKTKVFGHNPNNEANTLYYRKFAVSDDIIVGEIVPSNYDKMRWSEVKDGK